MPEQFNRLQKDRWVVYGVTTSDNEEWYNVWQQVVQRMANKCYNEWQRMTMSENEWVTKKRTIGDIEWKRVIKR